MEKEKHGCENVFKAIGFPPDEAAALSVRSRLLMEFEQTLKKKGKKQKELTEELGVPRTRISEIMNQQDKFSIERLVMLLARAGKKVSAVIS